MSDPQLVLQPPEFKPGAMQSPIFCTVRKPAVPHIEWWFPFENPAKTSVSSLDWTDWKLLRTREAGDHWIAFSPVPSHPIQRNITLGDSLDVPKRAAATFLPADVKNAELLEYDETGVIALFKLKNYKVLMCE